MMPARVAGIFLSGPVREGEAEQGGTLLPSCSEAK